MSTFSLGENMGVPEQFLYRQVQVHPPEADWVADRIRGLVQKLTAEHSGLDTISINVCYDWRGSQKDRFFDQTRPKVKKLGEYIDYLRTRESFYRQFMVWKWESYTNPAWEEYMRRQ
jgi:hypothetical protein